MVAARWKKFFELFLNGNIGGVPRTRNTIVLSPSSGEIYKTGCR